jgi:hypothetical protein
MPAARKLSDEHKAKLAEGRKRKAENNEDHSEVESLRKRLAELEGSGDGVTDSRPKTLRREKQTQEPVKGELHAHLESMKEFFSTQLDDRLARLMPERADAIREKAREPARHPAREGAAVSYDREGKPVYRNRDTISDPFAVPSDLREKDWDLQWVRASVHGEEDINNQVAMQENGWRPVLANRPGWDGRFMPRGYKDHIHKQGLVLMERPMILTEEAKREDARKVREQTKQQREQFGLALPKGFTAATPAARQHSGVKIGRPEATPDDLKPVLEIE